MCVCVCWWGVSRQERTCFLLDFTQHVEKSRLHPVTVQRVLPATEKLITSETDENIFFFCIRLSSSFIMLGLSRAQVLKNLNNNNKNNNKKCPFSDSFAEFNEDFARWLKKKIYKKKIEPREARKVAIGPRELRPPNASHPIPAARARPRGCSRTLLSVCVCVCFKNPWR